MYIDPGFGGMLIQIVVTVIAAGGAIAFSMRKKIRALFSKNKSGSSEIVASAAKKADDNDGIVDMLSDEDDED